MGHFNMVIIEDGLLTFQLHGRLLNREPIFTWPLYKVHGSN